MSNNATPIPEGLDLITDYQGVVIRRKWFSHIVWFLFFFAIAWDTFLVGFYISAFKHKDGPDLVALLFPICHLAVGVGITYYVLCVFLNKTDLLIRPDSLEVKNYPLPWVGSKKVGREQLTGFLVRERFGNKNGVSYNVSYVDENNREQPLLSGMQHAEQAEYVATYLTGYYGLPTNS